METILHVISFSMKMDPCYQSIMHGLKGCTCMPWSLQQQKIDMEGSFIWVKAHIDVRLVICQMFALFHCSAQNNMFIPVDVGSATMHWKYRSSPKPSFFRTET